MAGFIVFLKDKSHIITTGGHPSDPLGGRVEAE